MNPSRRSLFTALASVAPAGDDPIYAAIERHRATQRTQQSLNFLKSNSAMPKNLGCAAS
jgi:hypothetical protein